MSRHRTTEECINNAIRVGFVATALTLSACVPQGKYDAAAKDLQNARTAAQREHDDNLRSAADTATARAQIDHLNTSVEELRTLASECNNTLASAQANSRDMRVKMDGAVAENDQLRKELTRFGKNADSLLAEKGSLARSLAEAKARLDELRKAQVAADARAALFKQLALKFQKMIDAGELKISLRNGRMVLELRNDVLFDSGHTVIKPQGKLALTKIAPVLRTILDRHFQVAGDTDNMPIVTSQFPSNWELSTRRAVEVVRFLIGQGMRPELLSAAGYGEFDPVSSNNDPEGRARNRRIEITLQPNIDELVSVPNAQ